MHMEKQYNILQVVPMYGGDYSDKLWEEEENRSTHCCREINRRSKFTFDTKKIDNQIFAEKIGSENVVHN